MVWSKHISVLGGLPKSMKMTTNMTWLITAVTNRGGTAGHYQTCTITLSLITRVHNVTFQGRSQPVLEMQLCTRTQVLTDVQKNLGWHLSCLLHI